MAPRPNRTGFSLIEALVVLAVGGMALAVIFSIGIKAGDTGFSLGRRAMNAADADLAVSDVRSLIRSVLVRPPPLIRPTLDGQLVGAEDRLEADAVMERATQCAPEGWAGRLTLAVESAGPDAHHIVCTADDRRAVLLTVRRATPTLSYSRDGLTWSPTYLNAVGQIGDDEEALPSERLFVRIRAGDDLDLIESVNSGPPRSWRRPDDAM